MRYANELTKEQFHMIHEVAEPVFNAAYQAGWRPMGTTQTLSRLKDFWGRELPAGYFTEGALIDAADARELALGLAKAWKALRAGERLRPLTTYDNRLRPPQLVDIPRAGEFGGGWDPLEGLSRGGYVGRGALWAAWEFFKRGGAVLICLDDEKVRLTDVTIRMTRGVQWKGRTIGAGEIVTLPISEAGQLVGEGRAEEAAEAASKR
jgi:hypothetical protein